MDAVMWEVGDRVAGLYEVRAVHGQGAMGLVYRVRHLRWHVDLAVKSPRPQLFRSEGDKQRFVREAETWVSLGLHPHVCGCHYVRTLGGIPRVFAEYVGGGSLREWIDDGRLYQGGPRKALARVIDLAIQIAWGLEHAHANGVVHQDVKPANVLVGEDGTAKVSDFGLARSWPGDPGGGPVASQGGSILVTTGGMTPAYASPEQVAGARLTRRSDVWSYAVSVLEMVVGEVTWLAGPAAGAALVAYRHQSPPDTRVAMPPSLADVLARCLRDEPDQRPVSMREVAAALAEIYEHHVGHRYGRIEPRSADLRADELNNRALSLLDLGRVAEAHAAFDKARAADPHHLEATYNSRLLRWRAGAVNDDDVLAELESIRAAGDTWQARHRLAQVHLERGDPQSARPLLEQVARQAPDDPQVRADLEHARSDGCAAYRTLCVLREPDGKAVRPAGLSADGRMALSREDDIVRVWDTSTGRPLRSLRHPSVVMAVDMTDDGRLVLTGTGNARWVPSIPGDAPAGIHLWSTDTGACLRTLEAEGVTFYISSLCLGHNGRFALSAAADDVVQLWDLDAGRLLHRYDGVWVIGDGHVALSGAADGTVRVWDLQTGEWRRTLHGHTAGVTSRWLDHDGRHAVSCAEDGTVRLWDLRTGSCLQALRCGADRIHAVCLGPERNLLLTGDDAGAVQVWDVPTGRRLRVLRGHAQPVTAIRVSRDGRLALSSAQDNSARVWDLTAGRCLQRLDGWVLSDRGRLVTADSRGGVRVWAMPGDRYAGALHLCRPRTHAELARVHARVEGLLEDAERALADGRFTAAEALLRDARDTPGWQRAPAVLDVWRKLALSSRRVDLRAAWPTTILRGHTGTVVSLDVSADVRTAVSVGGDDVRVWELDTGRCLRTVRAHAYGASSVHLNADGRTAVSCGGDATARVWELESGRCLRTLHAPAPTSQAPAPPMQAIRASGDGRIAVSGGIDGAVRVWDLRTGHCLRVLRGHTKQLYSVDLTTDGRTAVSAGLDCGVRVWDVEAGRCRHTLGGDAPYVTSLRLSADGRVVVSGHGSESDGRIVGGTVRVWDLETGRCLRTLDAHRQSVVSVDLSADGRFAFAGGWDGTVGIWDLETGSSVATLRGSGMRVAAVRLSADGRVVLATGRDGTVQVWEIDWELSAQEPVDWDDAARPHLTMFLRSHMPWSADVPLEGELSEEQVRAILTRRGAPSWTEADVEGLLRHLAHAGYGWLRPEGVRAQLDHMARQWQDPPSAVRG